MWGFFRYGREIPFPLLIYLYLGGFVFFFLNWSIVDLQCFRCTAKWFSYIYTYIYLFFLRFFFCYLSLQDTEYSSLRHAVGPCCISILYTAVCICFHLLNSYKVVRTQVVNKLLEPNYLYKEQLGPAFGLGVAMKNHWDTKGPRTEEAGKSLCSVINALVWHLAREGEGPSMPTCFSYCWCLTHLYGAWN